MSVATTAEAQELVRQRVFGKTTRGERERKDVRCDDSFTTFYRYLITVFNSYGRRYKGKVGGKFGGELGGC